MNGTSVQTQQVLQADADGFLKRSVQDLFSLAGRTIVITGGARGIGLALAFAVAEVGGNVAVVDVLSEPHPHFQKLKEFEVEVKLYK
jgi:sorbose reductase